MKTTVIFALLLSFVNIQAHATGYERGVFGSGRFGPISGAGNSFVSGPESLVLNPAGLAGAEGTRLSVNLQGIGSIFQAPTITANQTETSDTGFNTPFTIYGSHQISPKFGIGFGFGVVGGSGADYGPVSFATVGYTAVSPTFKSSLQILEGAIGAAYEIVPGLKFGAVWRITYASAEFATAFISGTNLIAAELASLSATNFTGVRLGLQYSPEGSKWGLGLRYRNSVSMDLEGTATGNLEASGTATAVPISSSAVTVGNAFPFELTLGGHYFIVEKTKLILDYRFINYSENKQLRLGGTLTDSSGAVTVPLSALAQHWTNTHGLKFAVESWDLFETWAFRMGIAYVSPISSKGAVLPVTEAPGNGYAIGVGTGTKFERMELNFGMDFGFVNANVSAAEAGTSVVGDYGTYGFSLYTGIEYVF